MNPSKTKYKLFSITMIPIDHCTAMLKLGPFALWLGGFRIQPTFALVRVVRGDLSWDINCPIPPAHCMLGLLACR